MADNRYGEDDRRDSWRGRDSSIFSDDGGDRGTRGAGRWSSEHGGGWRSGGSDDRGFLERAGDEVRSWFGDEEAERRRERDLRRDEGRSALGGGDFGSGRGQQGRQEGWGSGQGSDDYRRSDYGGGSPGREPMSSGGRGGFGDSPDRGSRSRSHGSTEPWGGGDYQRQSSGGRQYQERSGGGHGGGAWGGGGFGGSHSFDSGSSSSSRGGQQGSFGKSDQGGNRSQWDDNYRRWREQQLQQFDSEYEDYRRERQTQFDRDFESWRNSRLTGGGTGSRFGTPGDASGASSSGQTVQQAGGSSGYSGDSSRNQGIAGATSSSLGSEGAGAVSSGGGSASASSASTGSTGALQEERSGSARGGRSRSRS